MLGRGDLPMDNWSGKGELGRRKLSMGAVRLSSAWKDCIQEDGIAQGR